MARCVYLTHPEVVVDPAVPVPDWGLSEVGQRRLDAVDGAAWLAPITRIVSSSERKATETAERVGRFIGVAPEVLDGFGENDRSATGYLPEAAFQATADAFFAAPDESVKGWETACDAQTRIVRHVRDAFADRSVPTLFVGHGGVGTLLRCDLMKVPIARSRDQSAPPGAPGGGNILIFDAANWAYVSGWTALEDA